MSIMICNRCNTLYGPTILTCPQCGSTDVGVTSIKPPTVSDTKLASLPQSNQVDAVDEKQCTKCKQTRPVTEFGASKKYISGYNSQCQPCKLQWYREVYYPKHKAAIVAKNEKYRQEHWDTVKKNTYNRIDPEKQKARHAINNAVKAGKFNKTICERCPETKVDFHHSNGYDKPNWFTGVWLCRKHHSDLHKELRWEKN